MLGIFIIGIFLNFSSLLYAFGGCGPFFNAYNPMFFPMRANFLPCGGIRPQMLPQTQIGNILPNVPSCTNCNPIPQTYQEIYPQSHITPPLSLPQPPSKPIPITMISQESNQQNPMQIPIYKTIYTNTYPTPIPSTNCKECFEKLSIFKYLQHKTVPEGDPINEQSSMLTKTPKLITEYGGSIGTESKNPFVSSMKQGLIEQESYDGMSFSVDKKEGDKVECSVPLNGTYYNPPPATSSYPTNECCVDCEEECQYNPTLRTNYDSKKFKKIRRLLGTPLVNTDVKCINKQLRNILSRYIGSDAKSSVKIIQKVADETLLEAHNVICSEGTFYYITRSSSFCQLTIGNVHCYIFRVIP